VILSAVSANSRSLPPLALMLSLPKSSNTATSAIRK
jgi:hypothetical protein